MKFNQNFKNRFRILKGGKISLVLSALLITTSTTLYSAETNIGVVGTPITTKYEISDDSTHDDPFNLIADSAIEVDDDDGVLIKDTTYNDGTTGVIFNVAGAIKTETSGYGIKLGDTFNNGEINIEATGSITSVDTGIFAEDNITGVDDNTKSTIFNEGAINVTGTSADAHGIHITNATAASTYLVIKNNGTITTAGGHGIFIDGSVQSTNIDIFNNHTITSADKGIYATDLTASTLNNSYIITSVNGGIVADALDSSTLTNAGNITNTSTGTDTAAIDLGTVTDSTISNSGNIREYGTGYAVSITSFDATSTFTNSGAIIGKIDITGVAGSTFKNTNTIQSGLGTTIVMDNVDFSSTGRIVIDVASETSYTQMTAENITLDGLLTIDVTATDQEALKEKTLEDVIVANGTLTVEDTLAVEDNSALLSFEYEIDSSDDKILNIVISEQLSVESGITPNNPNQENAAKVIDQLSNAGNDLDGFTTALNNYATNEEVTQAVKETTPIIANAVSSVVSQVNGTIAKIIDGRQSTLIGLSGANSGDYIEPNDRAWMKVFGSVATQDDKDNFDGYSANSYGAAYGIDLEMDENEYIGVSFVYGKGDVDVNNVTQTSDIDMYNILAYGTTPVFDNSMTLFLQTNIGLQKVDSKRFENTLNTTASATYNTLLFSGSAKLLKEYKSSDRFTIIPNVNTKFTYTQTPTYTEEGAGSLNLSVDEVSDTSLFLSIGSDFKYTINDNSNLIYQVGLGYDIMQNDYTSTSAYAGDTSLTFSTKGIEQDRLSYTAGLGYEYIISDSFDLFFDYNFEGRGSDYFYHGASAKLSWAF